MSRPSVAIVGGGILGLTAAYRLAQRGVDVALFERSQELGGLAGSVAFGNRRVDRFYHVVLPGDDRVLGLARELGLGDDVRFRSTRTGFYDDGRLFSMSSAREFATFPLLRPLDRVRLAAFVLSCRRGSAEELDHVPLLDWLRRSCGDRVVARLWEPLLDSKFDGRFDDLPATYLWARTRRMSSTRGGAGGAGGEVLGWIRGGYQSLVDRLVERVEGLGGEVEAGATVSLIDGSGGRATGLTVDGRRRAFDAVLATLVPQQVAPLLASSLLDGVPEPHCRYLGVVCLLVRTARSVSPYYTLNITDRRIPLTTVVESTHVVDPTYVGGSLLYVTRYVDPAHPDLERPANDVAADYLEAASEMLPDLHDAVVDTLLQRAPVVEPVHLLGGAARIPPLAPLPGLVLASTAHVYPEIVNGQSVIGVADRAVGAVLRELGAVAREAA